MAKPLVMLSLFFATREMGRALPTSVINYYTEGVRKFQPRVCFETLGIECVFVWTATLKELQGLANDAQRASQPLWG
jgi:hypothetical protein